MLLLLQRSTHATRVLHNLLRLCFEVLHSTLGHCAPTYATDGPTKNRLQHRAFAIRACLAGRLACNAMHRCGELRPHAGWPSRILIKFMTNVTNPRPSGLGPTKGPIWGFNLPCGVDTITKTLLKVPNVE